MDMVICPVCSRRARRDLFYYESERRFWIIRCTKCAHQFMHPPVSKQDQALILDDRYLRNIRLLSNGIVAEWLSNLKLPERQAHRQQALGAGEHDLVVIFVGQLEPYKGVRELELADDLEKRRHMGEKGRRRVRQRLTVGGMVHATIGTYRYGERSGAMELPDWVIASDDLP